MDNVLIRQLIRKFIVEHFPSSLRHSLTDTDPLLESGVIDSLGVLDLVTFLETKFIVTVDDEELIPENFQNIARIAAFIESKPNGSGASASS